MSLPEFIGFVFGIAGPWLLGIVVIARGLYSLLSQK